MTDKVVQYPSWHKAGGYTILKSEDEKFINEQNPLPSFDIDLNGRSSPNTVFGEKITGIRKSQLAAQFQYGIRTGSAKVEPVSTGSFEVVDSLLKISTGTASDGAMFIESSDTIVYIPGQEVYCFFTAVFSSPAENSYQRAGLYDLVDGFFVGYHGTQFCFTRKRDGEDFHTEIDLDLFNSVNGYTLDPQKGNVYKISYGYLGFAPISLEVLTPNGELVLLSKIKYPNSSIVTHTTQTFLPVRGEVANEGNTTNIVLSSGSFCAGIVDGGGVEPSSRQFSYKNITPFIVNGNSKIVAFKIKDTFFSKENRIQIQLLFASGGNDLNKNSRWSIYKNPTITNTPTWTDVLVDESVVQYSTDILSTFNSGELDMAWNSSRVESFKIDLVSYILKYRPGDIFVVQIGTEGIGESDFSIRWKELF